MGWLVTLGKFMANKRALATVKYYGGKLGNLLLMFASHPSPCAGNIGAGCLIGYLKSCLNKTEQKQHTKHNTTWTQTKL